MNVEDSPMKYKFPKGLSLREMESEARHRQEEGVAHGFEKEGEVPFPDHPEPSNPMKEHNNGVEDPNASS